MSQRFLFKAPKRNSPAVAMRCADRWGLIFCVVGVVSHRLPEDTLEVVATSLIQRSLPLGENSPDRSHGYFMAVEAPRMVVSWGYKGIYNMISHDITT